MKNGLDQQQLFAGEAEQSIVAALFGDCCTEVYDRLCVKVKSEDFYFPQYRVVFDAFGELIARDICPDSTTLATYIKSSKGYSDFVRDAISDASATPFSLENIEAYAEAVVEKSRARQINKQLSEIGSRTSLVGGQITSQDLLREIEAVSLNFEARVDEVELFAGPAHLLQKTIERLQHIQDGDLVGVKTGIDELDEKLGGLMPGDLVIVAGRPSMGKTAFALSIAAQHGIRSVENGALAPLVTVFSLEMGTEALGCRFLSNIGRVDHDRLRKAKLLDDDWTLLTLAMQRYQDGNIEVDCDPTLTPAILRGKLRLLKRKRNQDISLVIVDYLQLMDSDSRREGNRNEQVTEISRNLKKIAKEFGCPVIALSQLNRSVESRADKRPMMSDLRESGAIEQDADVILMMYRDEYYNPDSPHKGVAEIIAAKARAGGVGMVPSIFQGEYQRFENIDSGTYSYDKRYAN